MEARSPFLLALPFVFWGGSPSRILGYSSTLAGSANTIARAESLLQSSDPEYTSLLMTGGKSWIDVPFRTGENRLFIMTMLFEEQGFRPEWHYLAMLIEKDEWKLVGSHKRLLQMLDRYSKSSWRDLAHKDCDNAKLYGEKVGGCPSSKTEISRFLQASEEEALDDLERACLLMDEASFAVDKIAWNPAVLNSGWKCVVLTRKRSYLAEESFVYPWERSYSKTTYLNKEISTITKFANARTKANKHKILLFVVILLVLCSLAVTSYLLHKKTTRQDMHFPTGIPSLTRWSEKRDIPLDIMNKGKAYLLKPFSSLEAPDPTGHCKTRSAVFQRWHRVPTVIHPFKDIVLRSIRKKAQESEGSESTP